MFVAQASVAAANLPITVILARELSPSGYGEFQTLNRLALLAISVTHLGFPHALSWAMTGTVSTRDRSNYLRLGIAWTTASGMLLAAAALPFTKEDWIPVSPIVWIGFCFYPLANLVSAAIANASRGNFDLRSVLAIRLSQVALYSVAILTLWEQSELSISSAIVALITSQYLSAIVALIIAWRNGALTRREATRSFAPNLFRKFAFKVFPGLAIRDWNAYADQIVIALLLPPEQLGLYSVAVGLTFALTMLNSPISTTAQPLVQRSAPQDQTALVAQLLVGTLVVVGGAAGALAALAPWLIPGLLGADYASSSHIVQLLCLGVVFECLTSCLHGVLVGLGAPAASSVSSGIGFAASVVGWIVAIPALGITGAAIVSVTVYCIVFCFMFDATAKRLGGSGNSRRLAQQVLAESGRLPAAFRTIRTRSIAPDEANSGR